MSYDSEVLADTPYLYWKLDEASGTTAADSSGNGRTGTYVGDVTLGAQTLSSLLGARCPWFNLTTTTGYVTRDVTDFPTTSDLTWEIWFAHDDRVGVSADNLISVSSASRINELLLHLTNSFWVNPYVANNTTTFILTGDADTARTVHLVATWARLTGTLTCYANGHLLGSSSPVSSLATLTATANIMIGQNNEAGPPTPSLSSGQHWPGRLQCFAIYPSALSAARIKAHYYAGRELLLEAIPAAAVVTDVGAPETPANHAFDALPMLPIVSDSGWIGGHGTPGTTSVLYTNKVHDSLAGHPVIWRTTTPDQSGSQYPGPGTWGVHTSSYSVSYSS